MRFGLLITSFAALAGFTLALPTTESSGVALPTGDSVTGRLAFSADDPTEVAVSGNATVVETLEARGKANIASSALNFIEAIIKGIEQDKERRAKFTQSVIADLRNQNPHFNYVICHVKHDKRFDGQQGVDWAHQHREFDIKIGGTIGYEIYAFRSGEFWRRGDGGYLNWAWGGYVSNVDQNGAHVVFVNPP